jgi:dihydrofolate reductase
MSRLVYGLTTSLDGYVNDPDGGFDWAEPDEEVHGFVNDLQRGVGTYLFGRRMADIMRFWDDEAALAGQPGVVADYAALWRAADKVVYSTTLSEPPVRGARLLHQLDLDDVRALKESSASDLAVGGPTLAAHLLRAGLVDQLEVFVAPLSIGGGTRFLPDDVRLDLALLAERRFASGTVFLRYSVRH